MFKIASWNLNSVRSGICAAPPRHLIWRAHPRECQKHKRLVRHKMHREYSERATIHSNQRLGNDCAILSRSCNFTKWCVGNIFIDILDHDALASSERPPTRCFVIGRNLSEEIKMVCRSRAALQSSESYDWDQEAGRYPCQHQAVRWLREAFPPTHLAGFVSATTGRGCRGISIGGNTGPGGSNVERGCRMSPAVGNFYMNVCFFEIDDGVAK